MHAASAALHRAVAATIDLLSVMTRLFCRSKIRVLFNHEDLAINYYELDGCQLVANNLIIRDNLTRSSTFLSQKIWSQVENLESTGPNNQY